MTKETLAKEYQYLVYKISTYFYDVPKEDLIQAGYIGLYEAYNNYQQNKNAKFSTYAFKNIYGSMYQYVLKNQKLKISRDILNLNKKIETARNLLAQKLKRIPSNQELALYLEKDPMEIEMAIAATKEVLSLDNDNEKERSIYETIPSKENISIEEKIDMYDSIKTLNKDEQAIIKSRYFKDMTQEQTARKLKMTQVMVSRYEKKAVEKMRNYMTV